ncbi:MAG: YgjV family protein [Alphaproteobacteria bacterium]|jgi:hypothetical protein|nr:YgjV family protein [Alphaproteobacteria bacterium]
MNELVLALSYLALAAVAWTNKYKYMLALNIVACALCGVYLLLSSAYVGAVVSSVAALSNFIQLILPSGKVKKRLMERNIIAVFFACSVSMFLYAKPSDIAPCLAFSINRLSEAQENTQIIRYGLILSAALWSYYGLQHELWFFVIAELAVLLLIIAKIWNYKNDPKPILTP